MGETLTSHKGLYDQGVESDNSKPISCLVGFGSDGAPVMTGVVASVGSRFVLPIDWLQLPQWCQLIRKESCFNLSTRNSNTAISLVTDMSVDSSIILE